MTQTGTAAKQVIAIGQRISFSPDGHATVRLQRVETGVLVVTVEHTQLVDELRRSFPADADAQARAYARGLCEGLRAGLTVDQLVEIVSALSYAAA